MPGHVPGIRV